MFNFKSCSCRLFRYFNGGPPEEFDYGSMVWFYLKIVYLV